MEDPTILVVDDTEDNLDLLEFAMKRKPVRLLRATSGKECLSLAQDKNPDVILLDIQMPEMDGFETLRRLRGNPLTAKIPVIFLTAQRKDAESIRVGLELGAEEYLTKPIDTEELLVRTRMLVRVKRAEAELERTKADFMAMLVHDLRSPLSGIKSALDFLREMKDQGKQITNEHLQLLDTASETSRRLLDLINDILDLSKFEAGSMTLDKQAISIKLIIDVVCREMQIQYRQKNVMLVTALDENLPQVTADPEKIGQVMMNLLNNALKFTPGGGTVSVSAGVGEEQREGDQVPRKVLSIKVSDTGVGIPQEELPKLFERYKQVSSAKKSRQKGTGLGLSICKMIIEAHGGRITVESELGKSTTFRFTLPVMQPAAS